MNKATPLPTLAGTSEAAEVQRLFDLQHTASRRELAPTLDKRKERLDKIRTMLLENQAEHYRGSSDDFGYSLRPLRPGSWKSSSCSNAIRYARKHLGGGCARHGGMWTSRSSRQAPGYATNPSG